jgi:hypothetical protein
MHQADTTDWQILLDAIPRSPTGRIEPCGPRVGDVRTNPPTGEAWWWDGRQWQPYPRREAMILISGGRIYRR